MTRPGKPERSRAAAAAAAGAAARTLRPATSLAIGLAMGLLVLTGCSGGNGGDQAGGSTASTAPATSTAPPSASPTTEPQPTATGSPTTPPGSTGTTPVVGKLRAGDHGPAVLALQEQLSALGYWLGTPDGHFGDLTTQAVYALQKAAGLQRDGVVGAKTRAALGAGKRPTITTTGTGHRIEINKRTELLLIIDGSKITTILNTSTGSGRTFEEKGHTGVALTPSGSFRIYRQIDGNRIGPLGALWRPKYFNGGIAIHGIASVPPYPASHGCARLSFGAIDWIWATNQAPIGTSVTVV